MLMPISKTATIDKTLFYVISIYMKSTDIWFSDKNLQDTAKTSSRNKPQNLVYPYN
jgi:hypothetical protein